MATEELPNKTHGDYTVGWICALSKEQTAATAMLDKRHGDLSKPHHDSNTYTLGSIGKHNVVIACLPEGRYGTNSAANVVTLLAGTFPSVRSCLMVGIGGGIPSNKVRLGDVVVGRPEGQYPGVVQWDMGRAKQGGEFERTGTLDNPPKALLTALTKLKTDNELNGSKVPMYLDELKVKYPKAAERYLKSDSLVDILFKASYNHVTSVQPAGNVIREDGDDDEEEEEEEDGCRFCDKTQVVKRKPRDMRVHYGLIASGNQVIKDAKTRDKLNKNLGGNVLCVEMEAAGIANNFPCFVIRGICDYADSHKNKAWQEYAAAVAAAYAKELLSIVQLNEVQGDRLIKDVLNEVKEVHNNIERVRKAVQGGFIDTKSGLTSLLGENEVRKEKCILNWLSKIDYAPQQNDYISRREQGTGERLLRSPEFTAWLEAGKQTLFCPGIPGAGKTIQTSILVDHLIDSFYEESTVGVAYQYFNFQRHQDQKAEFLMANLIKQLAQYQTPLPSSVKSLYERLEKKKKRPSLQDLLETLQSVVSSYSRVFVVLDALDECDDSDGSRTKLLDGLFNIQSKVGLNLFATSRFIESIEKRFAGLPSVTIRPSQEDIFNFLDKHMAQLPDFVQGDEDLQNEIKTEIEAAIEGMFLLARLYLDSLAGKRSTAALRKALKGLRAVSTASPDGMSALDEAYEKAMGRIQLQKGDMPRDAILILSWVVNARRQLTVPELQEALAVEVGKSALDKDNIPTVEHITEACAPLVVIDEESNIIRLVHYTTQEYFERRRNFWLKNAQIDIARITVTYLSFTAFESGVCPSWIEVGERTEAYKLYRYAVENWGHHAQEALTRGMEARELIDFLESDQKREAASQLIMAPAERPIMDDPRQVTALHLTGYFGLYEAMILLLERGHSPSAQDTHGHTPLWWAARRGHLSVVKLLLERGAEADMKDNRDDRTPLWWAATNDHAPVVELLLKKDVDLESKDSSRSTPLASAAINGHTSVVKLLLEKGAHPDSQHRLHSQVQEPLFQDSRMFRYRRRGSPQTPLSRASRNGYEEIVRLLLSHKANVEAKDDYGVTPLARAARNGYYAVAHLLLNHNADVNAQDNTGTTILHWAALKGHEKVISLLLEHGADVETQNAGGGTALTAAVEGGYVAVAKLLLGEKAKVNYRYHLFQYRSVSRSSSSITGPAMYVVPQGYEWGTPGWLEKSGDRYYIDNGYFVDASEWIRRRQVSPLWRAAEKEDNEMVKLLLKEGAELDFSDGAHYRELPWGGYDIDNSYNATQIPLLWAAKAGKAMVVKMLVERGEDVTATNACGEDALTLAAKEGHAEIVSFLLATNKVDADRKG